jgi:hypothetical protein
MMCTLIYVIPLVGCLFSCTGTMIINWIEYIYLLHYNSMQEHGSEGKSSAPARSRLAANSARQLVHKLRARPTVWRQRGRRMRAGAARPPARLSRAACPAAAAGSARLAAARRALQQSTRVGDEPQAHVAGCGGWAGSARPAAAGSTGAAEGKDNGRR